MTIEDRAHIVAELKPAFARASNNRAKLDQIEEKSRIIEDVGLASLDILELRFELEDRWQTQITDEQAMRMRTVGDVVDVILQRNCSENS